MNHIGSNTDILDEAKDGVDYNGDGDKTDIVTEMTKAPVDLNGDGDTLDVISESAVMTDTGLLNI